MVPAVTHAAAVDPAGDTAVDTAADRRVNPRDNVRKKSPTGGRYFLVPPMPGGALNSGS